MSYWEKGYIFEAASALIEECFKSLNVRRFIAHCNSEIIGFIRVMEKAGMYLVEKCSGRKNAVLMRKEKQVDRVD